MKKIEKLMLLKLKDIIYHQIMDEDYYTNAGNVLNICTVFKEDVIIDGRKIEHNKYMINYSNGFSLFKEKYFMSDETINYPVEINKSCFEFIQEKSRKKTKYESSIFK